MLAHDPQRVSLLFFAGVPTATGGYGHIDIRLGYGAGESAKDRDVGFGPEAAGGMKDPFAYFGVTRKLRTIRWNVSFEDDYRKAALENMATITSLTLDLDRGQKNRVVDEVNELLQNGEKRPYNLVYANCATIIAEILEDVTGIKRGVLGFVPAQLEKVFRPHAVRRLVYPSGADLKLVLLRREEGRLGPLFKNPEERAVLEAQLTSRRTGIRILAYKKLRSSPSTAPVGEALLRETESPARAAVIRTALASGDNSQTAQKVLKLGTGEIFKDARIRRGNLVLTTEAARGSEQNFSSGAIPERREMRWPLETLGLRGGADTKWEIGSLASASGPLVHLWITKDLQIDPL